MPTGYTYGIIEGKITTFPQFAKLCMKAFGACMHMRDEDNDKEYTPQRVSPYHSKALKDAQVELFHIHSLTDEEIIKNRKVALEARIVELEERIIKTSKTYSQLLSFLIQAKEWKAPTKDHKGIKEFMIEQLESTIKFDGDISYYQEELAEVKKKLEFINPLSIRTELIASAKHDIDYHTKEWEKEKKRVKDANKWVTDLLKSFK